MFDKSFGSSLLDWDMRIDRNETDQGVLDFQSLLDWDMRIDRNGKVGRVGGSVSLLDWDMRIDRNRVNSQEDYNNSLLDWDMRIDWNSAYFFRTNNLNHTFTFSVREDLILFSASFHIPSVFYHNSKFIVYHYSGTSGH